MTDSSAPTSDDGELRGRLSTKNFLSHLHVQHGAAAVGGHAHQLGIINANSGDVVSAGEDHPVVALDNGALQSRSLRHPPVSFANVQVKGNDDANGRRTTGQQHAGDDDRSSFLSSCGASNDAVAHLSPRGDVQKKRTPSCTPPNEAAPGGEFTFRCSSTMAQSPNSRSSLPGVDLVGAIICAQHDESPASSVSSPRISGKRYAFNGTCTHRCRMWVATTVFLMGTCAARVTRQRKKVGHVRCVLQAINPQFLEENFLLFSLDTYFKQPPQQQLTVRCYSIKFARW